MRSFPRTTMTLTVAAWAGPAASIGTARPNTGAAARTTARIALRTKYLNEAMWFGRPAPPRLGPVQLPADSPPSDPDEARLTVFRSSRNPYPVAAAESIRTLPQRHASNRFF